MNRMRENPRTLPVGAVILLVLLHVHPSSTFSRSSYVEEIPKLQQCTAGDETRLMCGIKEHHADHLNASIVRWFFKPCGGAFQQPTCSNRALLDAIDWYPLECGDRSCRVTLIIRNATEANAGLYRCMIHPYRVDNHTQLDITLVRTFELVVTEWQLDQSIPAPELLDNLPANTTGTVGAQIVLQCRVYSREPPTIMWFRRLNRRLGEHSFNQNQSIRYLENFYELLPSAGEKQLSHDVYLSKLILHNASERDIGIYVCVGINYVGVSMADAYVNLVHADGTPVEPGGVRYAELLVLFLIPIGLALVPLLVWLLVSVLRAKSYAERKSLVQMAPVVVGESSPLTPTAGEMGLVRDDDLQVYVKVDVV
ncbi:fibroblast growth factor receptor-like 1 [Anopheles nili]|uniref:fibroblast growth factor receptor-like 1 n=1 Tax=Anopheles nili TaxID=185578 RepID=UPI00237A311A|nr:fibroblast growth factor receptor-like 1 [Anopheles nili]